MTEFQKLEKFLTPNRHFETEQDTLFFLVYIRRHLERKGIKSNFKIVAFYCDWALHYEKTEKIKDIENIVKEIQADICGESESNGVYKFLEMSHLKENISDLLLRLGLMDFTKNNNTWLKFRNNLIRILADCPLKVKDNYYIKMTYKEKKKESIGWEIEYQ